MSTMTRGSKKSAYRHSWHQMRLPYRELVLAVLGRAFTYTKRVG